ncbi:VWA domain-containing protein [Xylella taiwanensis]|uniref:VWA domain-containing protein n=2 Tax=Xylella taiwanensis TaxID=1444770 RepID=Z9JIA9_9GAMM|nr:VWA domain-containing protein [Xylella taiwanensis]AXI83448.1 hypothetical protein AB672_05625 [Xylella taiwanensis]EWS77521.1 hypothetical protein AF72_10705 [Xylella taiwanensis]MCD8466871.1 VWA domain-containing protein [Xylella taiwanensis]MCD8470793.1 VWA domain-containing protein [Xylella taiwanensis]MCD8473863.1 VWA domain-containing protein [Xylella taiwanensis]
MRTAPSVAVYFAIDLSSSMNTLAPNGQSRLSNMKSALHAVLDQLGEAVAAGAALDIMLTGFGDAPDVRQSIVRRHCTVPDITDVKAWVSSRVATYGTYFPAGTMDMPGFYGGAPSDAIRLAFFMTDGEPSAPAASIAQAARADVDQVANLRCYGINIDLSDTTYTDMVNNVPGTASPVVSGGDTTALAGLMRAGIFTGLLAMNVAHVSLQQHVHAFAYTPSDPAPADNTITATAYTPVFDGIIVDGGHLDG